MKHPGLIFPIYQKENQYSKGIRRILKTFVFPKCRGKYIALCEGDDYWTDPYKLQKQADFMEANPDCSCCFHAAHHVYENCPERSYVHRPKRIPKNGKFNIKHVILAGGGFMTTASMFFQSDRLGNYFNGCSRWPVGDIPLMLYLAEQGNIGYLDENMCVYRRLTNNSWSNIMLQREPRRNHYRAIQLAWKEFNDFTEHRYSFYIKIKLAKNAIKHGYAEIISLLKPLRLWLRNNLKLRP